MENISEQQYTIDKSNKSLKKVLTIVVLVLIIFLLGVSIFYFKDKFQLNTLKKDNIPVDNTSDNNSDINPFSKLAGGGEKVLGRSRFPEVGKILEHNGELLFIYKKDNSERPFFEKTENINNYSKNIYNIVTIPEQDSIKYVSGYFEGWEDIPGTLDKYLIIRYPPSMEVIKFRISFEESELFSSDVSLLFYETLDLEKNDMYVIEPFDIQHPDFISLTFNRIKDVIKKGDYVIVTPYFEPPEYNKKDGLGNYLASKVYIKKR